jgi:sec-independent protein translocase protein TatA
MNLMQPTHLLIIALVVLVLFGGSKIPQFMRGLGQGMGEFKKGMDESKPTEHTEAKPEAK